MESFDAWMWSEETGEPFRHCVSCGIPLLETDGPWLVNKEFHRGECTLEYAICQRCRDALSARLSEESKAAVRDFLEKRIDWTARVAEFLIAADLGPRFSHCISCRTPREDLDGFGVSAVFDSGGALVTGPLPLLICRTCVGEMTSRLSEHSRRVWKDFMDGCFTGPPADEFGLPGLF